MEENKAGYSRQYWRCLALSMKRLTNAHDRGVGDLPLAGTPDDIVIKEIKRNLWIALAITVAAGIVLWLMQIEI
ncbi:MAG: hypothetical protein C5B60_03510 [Chloroflexi bacterium]|nr:MAG: hypothetical protein C5B60_03510 [Chloroflexota bacterium]